MPLIEVIIAHLLAAEGAQVRQVLTDDLNVAHLTGYTGTIADLLVEVHGELGFQLVEAAESERPRIAAAMAVVQQAMSGDPEGDGQAR